MWNKRNIIIGILFISISFIFFIGIINVYVLKFSEGNIKYYTENIEGYDVGLVLGASVYNKTTPSPILQNRLNMARILYENGVIKKIIVSGDNASMDYNEPIAMKMFLLETGVDEDDIYLDYAGFDTYDSIFRAQDIFGVHKMIIFTQEYHLKRAIYIAQRLGIDGIGVEDDVIVSYIGYEIREALSRVKAFFDVEVLKSKPRYGGEHIKIISDQELDEAKRGLLEK